MKGTCGFQGKFRIEAEAILFGATGRRRELGERESERRLSQCWISILMWAWPECRRVCFAICESDRQDHAQLSEKVGQTRCADWYYQDRVHAWWRGKLLCKISTKLIFFSYPSPQLVFLVPKISFRQKQDSWLQNRHQKYASPFQSISHTWNYYYFWKSRSVGRSAKKAELKILAAMGSSLIHGKGFIPSYIHFT